MVYQNKTLILFGTESRFDHLNELNKANCIIHISDDGEVDFQKIRYNSSLKVLGKPILTEEDK